MTARVSCCLSAAGLRFLGHPVPPGIPPLLRSAYRAASSGADPSGVSMFRTRETRLAQGALCTPGAAVSTRPVILPAAACRFSTASPAAPDCNPPRDASLTRHQQGFTVIHPTPAFPSPVTPGGTGSSGFPLSFAPSRAGPGNARQGGDRPGHCLDYVPGISQPPSTYSLTTCDLTSQRMDDLRAIDSPGT